MQKKSVFKKVRISVFSAFISAIFIMISDPFLAYGWGKNGNGNGDGVIYSALIGAIASIIAGLLASLMLRRRKKQVSNKKEKVRNTITKLGIDLGFVKAEISSNQLAPTQAQLASIEEQIVARLSERPDFNAAKLEDIIENELEQFRDRISKIEERFPPEAQLDKIASIDDAVFSLRIDQLAKHIDALESRLLSRWDVAVIVSSMIGGIFAIVAATYAVISFFAKQ